jgi:hypothetical protein
MTKTQFIPLLPKVYFKIIDIRRPPGPWCYLISYIAIRIWESEISHRELIIMY